MDEKKPTWTIDMETLLLFQTEFQLKFWPKNNLNQSFVWHVAALAFSGRINISVRLQNLG